MEAAELYMFADLKRVKEYDARKSKGRIDRTPMVLARADVFVCADAGDSRQIVNDIQSAEATQTHNLLKATVCAVGDLNLVDAAIMMCAMLSGLTLATREFLRTGCGACINYKS